MEYLTFFNDSLNALENAGVTMNDEQIEVLRLSIQRTYKTGLKHGSRAVELEDMEVDKAVKLQRVMARYGVKK